MTDRVCLIGADNAMLDDNFEGDQDALDPGQRVVIAPLNMDDADGLKWSQELNGWVPKIKPAEVIPVLAFMTLFTQGERMAIRAARSTDPVVDDFWELMLAATSGISLQHPAVIAGTAYLVEHGLLAADRATDLLAGQAPS